MQHIGQFDGEKRHGYGIWESKSGEGAGDIYEGYYKNDKKEGFGRYFCHSRGHEGAIYEGTISHKYISLNIIYIYIYIR